MSRQYDDYLESRYEDERNKMVAKALDIELSDVEQLEYEINTVEGNEGAIHGYYIQFSDSTPKEILEKISRLEPGNIVYLDTSEVDYGDEDDNEYDFEEPEEDYDELDTNSDDHSTDENAELI